LDPVKAEEHRQAGNTFFKEGKYPDAYTEYSEAIRRNPREPILYSNRA
jgi:stress-induced-phosphoprotein 1